MPSASCVLRPEQITIAPHGEQSVVRCRRTRRTLILGAKETRLVERCSAPCHIDDLKSAVQEDFSGRDVEKIVVLLRDLGVLRGNDERTARQRPWSFRIVTIPLSGAVRHPRTLRVLADAISIAGIVSTALCAWLIFHHTPQVITSLLNQDYLSGSSLLTYLLAIVIIGFFHESSHAVTIQDRGGHVFETGFFLMFLIPAFYVDATGISMIRTKLGRIQAWCAGLCIQAVLLLVFLLVLVGAPAAPEWLHGFALLASCVDVAMVLANLIPIIRLDGYRVFCELVGVEDLINLGLPVLTNRPVPGSPSAVQRILAGFFAAVTILLVPCLIITAASFALPGWTGIPLETLGRIMTILMATSSAVMLLTQFVLRIRRASRHA